MFQVDKQSRIPIYEQLVDSIEKNILHGILEVDDKLISVRELSSILSINPNTIQKAYSSLESRGITYSTVGVGRFISNKAVEILKGDTSEQEIVLKNTINSLKLMGVAKERIETILNEIYKTEGNL